MQEKQDGAYHPEAQGTLDAQDAQLLMDLLKPLLKAGPRKSSLLTSGYLAARAKMGSVVPLVDPGIINDLYQDEVSHGQQQGVKFHNLADPANLQWSCRSSPGPQLARSSLEPMLTNNSDEMERITRFGSLHELRHHQVQHFCDDHNTRLTWRRRTLVFQKTP